MSGFENYPEELAQIDREIVRYAAICGIDVGNRYEVRECLAAHHENWAGDKARESLRGLLLLRLTLEAEMITQGLSVPQLSAGDARWADDGGG